MKNPQAMQVDICLGNAYSYNTYRYYSFSPCIFSGLSIKSISSPCDSGDYPLCGQNIMQYTLSMIPATMQTMVPIGLAKDGRIIYGPYRSDGTLWQPCEVDVCNGVK